MYIKWMTCSVDNNDKEKFSFAQEKWTDIQKSEGFIGQLGGWDLNDKNKACIISFWKNEKSLKSFMTTIHNTISLRNNQSKYYDSIEVAHFNSLINMEGEKNSFIRTLDQGKLLRITDCIVKEDNVLSFEASQRNVWLSGIKNNNGMLGGKFSKGTKNQLRYLVSTFWDSLENYSKYVTKKIPELKNKSNVKDHLLKIIGREVLLIDSWKILKKLQL